MAARPAASYVRCSSDAQADRSPEQQRDEIQALADREGYDIVATFEDIGISGDATDKREGFKRLIADGVAGKFDTILCWDQDRLGRFDLIDAGRWLAPLKEAGVKLHTVNGGVTDWSNLVDQLGYLAQQMGKHQYLRDLAKNVQRGHARSFANGKWTAGFAPYGYYITEERTLAIEPEEAPIVVKAFQRYAAGESLGDVAAWLNSLGIQTRRGNQWQRQSVRHMLNNLAYRGHLVRGRKLRAKYTDKPQFEVREDSHDAIISAELWSAAQQARDKVTKYTGSRGQNQYALSGLVKCGNCGASMGGQRDTSGFRRYICQNYQNRVDNTCDRRTVREDDVLSAVLEAMREQYFEVFEANRDAIVARMRELLTEGQGDAEAKAAEVDRKLAAVDAKLVSATDAVIEASADIRPRIEERIRTLEDERLKLLDSRPSLDSVSDQVQGLKGRIDDAIGWFKSISEAAELDFDRVVMNRSLKQFIDRIEVETERVQVGKSGKRFVSKLLGGSVYFTQPTSCVGLTSHSETSSTEGRVKW
ncbi:MAG: recombinase family protein [Planctomycetota bacterium]